MKINHHINAFAIRGEQGTGFEKGGDKGPFQCGNCHWFRSDSCGQKDMMAKSKQPRLPNGRVKVDADDCCEYVDRAGKDKEHPLTRLKAK